MDSSKNRNNEQHLGVNKMGKNIKKSPLHQPGFANNAARQQPQPQVYNINKNDFRQVVQQLTGSPSQESSLPRPSAANPSKNQNMRLQKIRPPPLAPINRPRIPHPVAGPPPVTMVKPHQFGQPSPTLLLPAPPGDSSWGNTAESPISAYMRYLQNSITDSASKATQHPIKPHPQPPPQHHPQPQSHPQPQPQPQSQLHPQVSGEVQAQQQPASGLMPNMVMPAFPSPRMNGPLPNLPSPILNASALFPSPASQFLIPSPTGYLNMLSPRSPYPLLSPGSQFPPPLSPNFSFSPMAHSGILGPGPQPPPSPGLFFPLSPSGFFPISSPRWRDQ